MKKLLSVLLSVIIIAMMLIPMASAADNGKWIAAWGTAAVDYFLSLEDYVKNLRVNGTIYSGTTIRTKLTVSAAGKQMKFKFSNQYGDTPVVISEATVARAGRTAASIVGNSTQITFNGQKSLTLNAGETVWSDPVKFVVGAMEDICVSTYYAAGGYIKTAGLFGGETYEARGFKSQCEKSTLSGKSQIYIGANLYTFNIIPFLTGIDVYSDSADAFSVAFIGDSTLVNDMPGFVSQRLVDAGYTDIGVVDEGIMGNRLLYNGKGLLGSLYGDKMLDRLDRDAIDLSGVDAVFVKIGANDVIHPTSKSMNAPYSSADDIINGYKEVIDRVKAAGKKVYMMEITQWNGYVREVLSSEADIKWSPKLQVMCDEINGWIENEAVNYGADGVITAPTLADITDPTKLRAQFTLDGAHLTSYGSMVLCDSIDLQTVLGLDKKVRTISEILNVNPYQCEKDDSAGGSKLSNILNIIHQLFTSLRVQFEGAREFFAGIFSKQYLRMA